MPESSSISPVKINVDFWAEWRYPHTLLETGIGGVFYVTSQIRL